jgi:hypothetical protein
METIAAGVTVKLVVPEIAPEVAVIVTDPAALVVNKPLLLMLAIFAAEVPQVIEPSVCVVLSVKTPKPENC